ncbi:Adseverin [Tetrabaena socialis]|uniref:Adseverin n=1 Tax=Tetrabaena socialis TaxID=47790 RepID=A0A2J7WF72_9CHLO|nr:Adseverin [Tetrabaena socialis]|eukprot:PNG62175.1 Adseverin [Tetrabaena socialis]
MLLDAGGEMYVWYGATCKPNERPRARDVAARYLAAAGRRGAAPLVELESGQEPPFFTCHFTGWDAAPVGRMRALSVAEGAK